MLAETAGFFLFARSMYQWTLTEQILYMGLMYLAVEGLSWGVFYLFENHTTSRIPAGGISLWERDTKDYAYIFINKSFTVMFAYHLANYLYWSDSIARGFTEFTFYNTILAIPLLFLVFDLPYGMFHRFLHVREVYGYIHKHHHAERAPTHGHDDAVNTHPFEFIVGEYLHLFAIFVVRPHMVTAITFVAIGGIMASLSHTRFDIAFKVGGHALYRVKDHDYHHRALVVNYCQYFHFWDLVFSTYTPWEAPIEDERPQTDFQSRYDTPRHGGGPNRAPRPTSLTSDLPLIAVDPLTASKKELSLAPSSVAVVNANSNVGRALISSLMARGVNRVVAIVAVDAEATALLKHLRTRLTPTQADSVTLVSADPTAAASLNILANAFAEHSIRAVFYPVSEIFSTALGANKFTKQARVAETIARAAKRSEVPALILISDALAPVMSGTGSFPEFQAEKESGDFIMNALTSFYNKIADVISVGGATAAAPLMDTYAGMVLQSEVAFLRAQSGSTAVRIVSPVNVYGPQCVSVAREMVSNSLITKEHIFGSGNNLWSFTHEDNVCHAAILAANHALASIKAGETRDIYADELSPLDILTSARSASSLEYYHVSDCTAHFVWDVIEKARRSLRMTSVWDCYHIYPHALFPAAYALEAYKVIRKLIDSAAKEKEAKEKEAKAVKEKEAVMAAIIAAAKDTKDSKENSKGESRVKIMEGIIASSLTPFVVSKMTQHIYFDCNKARDQLGYEPIKAFDDAFYATISISGTADISSSPRKFSQSSIPVTEATIAAVAKPVKEAVDVVVEKSLIEGEIIVEAVVADEEVIVDLVQEPIVEAGVATDVIIQSQVVEESIVEAEVVEEPVVGVEVVEGVEGVIEPEVIEEPIIETAETLTVENVVAEEVVEAETQVIEEPIIETEVVGQSTLETTFAEKTNPESQVVEEHNTELSESFAKEEIVQETIAVEDSVLEVQAVGIPEPTEDVKNHVENSSDSVPEVEA